MIDQLLGLDAESKARVWCALNCWEWPDDIDSKHKPSWWDGDNRLSGSARTDRKMGYNDPIMTYIEEHVPEATIKEVWKAYLSN